MNQGISTINSFRRDFGRIAIAIPLTFVFIIFLGVNAFALNSITISTGTTSNVTQSGTAPNITFTANATNSVLNVNTLTGQLAASNVTISATGNVTFSTGLAATPASTTQRTFTVTAGGNIAVNNVITLTPTTGSTAYPGTNVTLTAGSSGNVTISAAITSNGGSLSNGNGNGGNAGNFTITGPAGITITANLTNNAGTGHGSGGNGTDGNITISDGATTVTTGGGVNDGQTGGVIDGGALTSNGAGTFYMAGSNTYSAASGASTTISAGTLELGSASALSTGSVLVSSGAVLDLNGINYTTALPLTLNGTGISGSGALISSSTTAATYAGLITLGSTSSIVAATGAINITNTGTITGSGFGLTLGGAVGGYLYSIVGTGSGTLTVDASGGTWVLLGASTYTGATYVNNGILKFGAHENTSPATGPLGSATGAGVTVASGAAIDLGGYSEFSTSKALTISGVGPYNEGALRNSGGADEYAGLITLSGNAMIGGVGSTLAIANTGTITGSGYTLTLSGPQGGSVASIIGLGTGAVTVVSGTWSLTGANTYTGGTTISGGTLVIGAAGIMPGSGTVTMDGGTFSTGTTTFTSITMGPLDVTNNGGTITYGSTTVAQPLKFAASNTQSWGTGTLTITNWQGSYNGTVGTEGRIYTGTTNGGLTSGQLLQMQFFNGTSDYPAGILSTGEVVAEIQAPSNLSYNSPNTFTAGTAISSLSPSVTGTVTGYTVSPALPTGLSINATSGIISGTPTLAGTGTYTVTATNGSGSTTFGIVITVNPAALYKFAVTNTSGGSIATQTAGTAFNIEVVAEDVYSNTVTGFNSTVTLSENQPYGYITPTTSASFTNGILASQSVTLTQAVSTIITATNGSATGSSNSFTVNAGAFAKLQILAPGETAAPGSVAGYTGTPTAETAGTAFNVTVNAVDANWNAVTSTNSIAITSSDANATLPANAALVGGTKTFSITLKTGGTQTVTATDATTGTITANTTPSITVNAGAGSKLQILLPGETAAPGTTTGKTGTPTTQTAGFAFNATVNAVDANWNVVSTETNSVTLTASNGNTMPAAASLVSGTKTFSVTMTTVGTPTITATTSGLTSIVSANVTIVAGALSQFAVTNTTGGNIATQTAGTAFNIEITAQDAYGNTVTSFNSTVALTENQPYGTISPTTSGAFTNGVLASQSVTLTQAVSTIITATNGSTGSSNSFTVNPGAFAKLQILVPGETAAPGSSTGYTGSPNSEAAGTAFNVTVNAVDANWNVVTSAPANSIAITSTDGSATLPANANLASGTQTFSVTLKTVGTQTVTATDATTGTYTANTSPGITVTAGALSKFVVESTSNGTIGSQVAGTAFNVKIVAEDTYGNTVTSFNSTVALTENQPYGSISPATSGSFTNGVLASQSVTLTQAYATSTITATSGSATGTSNSFAVTAGAINKLQVLLPGQTAAPGSSTGYTGTPTAQTAGTAFTVTVNAVDANWNVVSSTNTVGITSSDANAVLPANAALVAGTQTFSITMKTAGLQTVTATDITTGTITANTSAQVTVNAGTFTELQILVPGQTAAPGTTTGYTGSPTAETAGTAFNVTVNAVDAYWNVVSSAPANSIAITSTDGNAALPANANLSSGTQTFSVTLKTVGTQTVTATDASNGAITASISPSITVNPGALSTFVITNTSGTSITTQTAGTAFTIKIVAQDAYGNTVTSFNSTVALTENQPYGTISPTTSSAFTNGVLTSQNVTLTQAVSTIITATSGTATGSSNSFVVNPGAFAKLQILVPGETAAPGSSTGYTGSASATTQGTSLTVTVNAVDANWNVVSAAPADNIHLTSTDGSASLPANTPLSSGTNTLTVTLYTTGSQTITASDATNGSITSSTSPAITVGAFATAATDYFRSNVSSGAWTTAGTWQSSHNNANWYTATAAPTSSAAAITILSGQTVSVTATPSYNNLTVNGTYQHALNGGTVPTATWASTSTLLITGATGATLPGGLNQTFNNVTWNWTTQNAAISLGTTNLLNINGAFTVTSTGSYNISYSSNTALTINMGSLVVNGGTFGLTNASSGSVAKTLNITGGVTLSSGSFNVDLGTSTAAHTINVGGNWANSLSTTFSADASTVVFNGSSAQTLTGPYGTTFYNLTVNETSSSTTVTSSGNAFAVSGALTVTQGNLILQAYDANYNVTGNLLISANGTLTHSVSWNSYGKLLAVSGNFTVNGLFTYTTRSTVELFGVNTTVTSGTTSGSAFDILLIGNSSGTIGASGPVVANDNFWSAFGVGGGTFSTNGYTVTANGGLLNDGGTININGGTLNVTGGFEVGYQTNGAVNFSSGILNVDGLTLGDVGNGINTAGTFTQSGGTMNLTGGLTIHTGSSFVNSGSPVINIGGNVVDSGTYTRSGETVTLNGSAAQIITGNVVTTFNNLVISNAAGITLGYNAGVSNTVTFTSGIITTGTNVFTLGVAGTAGTVAGSPGSGNYVYGNFQRYINNTSSPSVTFNVGDASVYAPVALAFTGTTSGSGSITVSTTSGNDPNENTPTTNSSGINQTEKVNRYWTMSNSGVAGFSVYNGTFNFASGDILNSANPLNFVLRKYNGGWATVTTGTLTGTSSQATGMTTFGDIEIGIANIITATTNPANSTICSGNTTSFSSTSASYPAPAVQWYRSNNGGSTYAAITSAGFDAGTTYSGYTSNTLTLTGSTTAVSGYLYEAVFTNINGSATSSAATLTVNPTPGDNAGSNVSICTGSNTVLGAASTTGHTYSWSPTTALSSSTVSNPTASPTSTTAYTLTETITATGCSVSNSVTVTVSPVIAGNTIGTAQTICANATPAALTGSTPTGGSGTYVYLWQSSTTSGSSGFSAASGTDNTQSYSPTAVGQNTWFNRVITSGGCTSTSSSVLITTNALPTGTVTTNYCDTSGYVQLTVTSASSYLWSSGATTQSTLVDEAGLYYVTITNSGTGCSAIDSTTVAVELVVNGDFSQGNYGFTSQYTYESSAANIAASDQGLVPQGLYAVDTNAHNYHPLFFGRAHTKPGTGNFMMINGESGGTLPIIWSENITVQPNTVYYFSAWAMSLNQVSPYAALQFSVNGQQVGTVDVEGPGAASTAGPFVWTRFYATWNSGSTTSVTLAIVDLQTAADGNDFGLDNVSCSTLAPVTFSVGPATPGAIVCQGDPIDLTSNVIGGSSPFTYSWSGPNSFTSDSVNPIITNSTSAMTGTYNLTVTNGFGCTATGSTTLTVGSYPNNVTATAAASSVCSASSTNIQVASSQTGVVYQLINNSTSANIGSEVSGTGGTINLPTGNLTSATTFGVIATNTTSGCSLQLSSTPTVSISTTPVLDITNQAACSGTVNLTASAVTAGSTGGGTLSYWTNSTGTTSLSNPSAVSTSGTYYIKSTVGSCYDIEPVVVKISTTPVATFSYTGSPYCSSSSNPTPTFSGGGVAGTFSSTSGLVFVSTSTGQINLSASTPGTYTVTNKITPTGSCSSVSSTSSVTITAQPSATFTYVGNALCQSAGASNPSPILSSGATAGTFSSTYGLTFVSTSTGQINIASSTPNNYAVTNTVAASGGCAAISSTTYIDISAYSFTGSVTAEASPDTICTGGSTQLLLNLPSYLSALLRQDFNGLNNWGTVNNSSGGVPANAVWTLEPDSFDYSSVYINSNDYSQFYMSNSAAQGSGGTTSTMLISPSMNSVGFTTLVLDFFTYFNYVSGATAKVQVSTDSLVWNTAATYTSTIGLNNNFNDEVVDLGAYINQPNLYIRFVFTGSNSGYWAIDNVSVTGYSSNYSYQWASSPSGYGSISEDPTGVAPTVNTSYSAVATNSYGCSSTSSSVTVVVNPLPTITTSAAATTVCASSSAQNSSLNYSTTTNSPTNYTIAWNSAALTAGLQNLSSTALPASPINIPVAANVSAGTYTGTLTVTNANGCASTGNSFTITINPLPTITTSATATAVCTSTGAQNSSLSYSATTNTPTNYTITWNSAAQTAGLQNVSTTTLPASPITVPVAANVAAGTYTGTLTVTNANSCASTGNSFTLTVNPLPTITTSATAAAVCTSTSAQNSSLSYSATANTPTHYTITWNSAAQTAGLQNVSTSTLPSSPITVPVAANVAAGTYTGTLTVTNANSCASTGNSFTLTVNPLPTITTSATATAVCTSTSAQNSSLGYSATTNTPTNYTITWNSTAQTAGLQNVSSTALPVSPITMPVAANVAAGTYTGTLTVSNANGCIASTGNSFTVTVNPLPTITTSATATAVCTSTSAQNSSLSYSATTNTPTNYTITWNSAAQTAGLQNVSSTALPSSPITVPVAANAAAGTYTGTVTVTNANSCASTGNTFTITINPLPTITTSATAIAVCASTSAQNSSLSYSATTNTPTNYTITWNSAAQTAGLQNVSTTTLPASPITVPVAANVAAGTYTGTLTVTNANSCASTGNTFTITINPLPTITTSATAAAVCTSTSAQNSSLSYSATANTPTHYTITWNSAAQTAGLQNVSSTVLPSSPITVPVAANVAAGTYTGTLTVTNANSCASTGNSFTLTINPLPTITTSATATAVCTSTSAQNSSLSYSATTNTPTNYTITWNSAAQTAGLQNVSSTALPSSPITVPVAANVAAGTYTGTLTVTNANSCASTGNTFTITINPLPTITTSATATAVCTSTSAQNSSLSYSATTNAPTNYTITWNSAAQTAGLQNVSTTALPSSPITVPVAANVAAGTYTGTLTVTNANSCANSGNSFTLTVNPLPTITTSASAAAVCNSAGAQNSSLSYSATTNTPTHYTITWNSAAQTAGLQNVSSTALPSSPITVPVAANVAAGTYTGTLTVSNANGCVTSTGNSFTITINPLPTITTSATATSVCASTSAQNSSLSYSATANTPTNYTISWNSAAQTAGLQNVSSTALPLSPITVPVAANVAAGTYTGTLTVTNGNSCASTGNSFTITINALPTITTSATAAGVCISTSAQSSSLSYSATTNTPTNYTITWNSAAQTAGLQNVSSTTLPASPITIPVAANVAAGTYTGTLMVTNANSCAGTGNSFTITVNPLPGDNTGANQAVCAGATVTLGAASTTGHTYSWSPSAGLSSATVSNPSVSPGATSSYTLTETITATGCSVSNSVTVTIVQYPNDKAVTPEVPLICSGSSTNILVANTDNNVNYQLRNNANNVDIGSAVAGTGGTIDLSTGSLTAGTTFNVYATTVSAGCGVEMVELASVAVAVPGEWLGISDTNWNNSGNWCTGVPTSTTNVIIPIGTPYSPVISSAATCHNLVIDTGNSLKINAGGVLSLYGNLTVGGTYNQTAGTLQLVGDSNQSIPGITAYNVIVNDSAGATLSGNLVITDSLELLHGVITTGANLVDIYDTLGTAVTAGNGASYIFGNLRRAVGDTGYYMFPVGDTLNYELASIYLHANTHSINTGFDSLTATFTQRNDICTGVPGSSTPYVNGSPLTSFLDGGYWTIHPENSTYQGISYDVALSETGYDNPPTLATEIAVIKRANCDVAWGVFGTHVNTTQSLVNSTATAVSTSLSSFSDFGIGFGGGGPLPVELVYLQANAMDNSYILVSWQTDLEINNYGFNVERSTDGQNWTLIGFVQGHDNSVVANNYSLKDEQVTPDVVYYYRLKQIDNNGHFVYTDIVTASITVGNLFTISDFIPNPSYNATKLIVNTSGAVTINVKLFDILGREISEKSYQLNDGENELDFNTSLLSNATYIAVINTPDKVYSKSLVVIKN